MENVSLLIDINFQWCDYININVLKSSKIDDLLINLQPSLKKYIYTNFQAVYTIAKPCVMPHTFLDSTL